MRLKGILNSLAFRIISSVLVVISFIGLFFYLTVLKTVTDFSQKEIFIMLEANGKDVYEIYDKAVNEIISSGILNEEKILRLKKAHLIDKIETFLKSNSLKGFIGEGRKEILNVGDVSAEMIQEIKGIKENSVSSISFEGNRYYVYYLPLDFFNWRMFLIKDAAQYSSMLKNVRLIYFLTTLILIMSALIILYYFRRVIDEPIRIILNSLKKEEKPVYEGIEEFELLSKGIGEMIDNINNHINSLDYIYSIAALKRGINFFSEVAVAISRLLDLNSLIGRLSPDGQSAYIEAMYINGELRSGFTIDLKGTPCEDVLKRHQLVVLSEGAMSVYPSANILCEGKGDSYIGFPIFDRKRNPIGILNAFGGKRDFSDTDIKVLRTIGQFIAAEMERIDEEKEKEKIQEQLFQAQKLEAIGTLAGGIAHDFNNMLQGILGYASLLKLKLKETDEMYKPIDIIEKTAERAAELTRQLLGFARKGKYFVEVLNPNDLVNDVSNIIKRTFDKSISIEMNLSPDVSLIEGDKSQLENSIMNICLNARDAMPSGGILRIETFNEDVSKNNVSGADVLGSYAVISISDTGIGIDEDIKSRIFEPFFTTKEPGKGTGMGLAMVYGIVKNHNGFITVDSIKGKGSTFRIYLPKYKKAVEDRHYKNAIAPIHGRGTLLIVDDEDDIRDFFKIAMSDLGYSVLEASNGKEALKIYNENKSSIDLIILDLIMPEMGGKEALIKLKEINPNIKVLISTGYGDDGIVKDLADKNIVGFIYKPFNIVKLSETIGNALLK
jgi:signal transduction histidine kinase/CheY-like chemotaxis protein